MGIRSFIVKAVGAAVVISGFAVSASAAPLLSGSGSATCELNTSVFGSSSCTLQVITPHAAWQVPAATGTAAEWVSYANTGVSAGNVLAPTPDDTSATPGDLSSVPWLMKVTETFSIGASGGNLFMQIWADDTASVYLNGSLLKAPNFTQETCAIGDIGCEPDEFGLFNEALAQGSYTLDIYVYQLGRDRNPNSNPFGLLYAGDVDGLTEQEVPAPAGLAFLGLGLLVAGLRSRRKA